MMSMMYRQKSSPLVAGSASLAQTGRARHALEPKFEDAAIFKGLSRGQRDTILSTASSKLVAEGKFIFREGQSANQIFLLASGRVRLQEVTSEGEAFLFRFVRPGETFGDRGAIPGERYGATAVVDTSSRVYFWKTEIIID